jgi:AAA domain
MTAVGWEPLPDAIGYDSEVMAELTEALSPQAQKAAQEKVEAEEALAVMYEEWCTAKKASLRDMLEMQLPAPLIDGNLLYCGTNAWLLGATGTYKSFLALDWSVCVATGTKWLGRSVDQGRVLYLTLEGSAGFSKRLPAIMDRRGVTEEQLAPNIDFVRSAQLKNVVDKAMLAEDVKRNGYKLMVIDTMARFLSGANENDKQEMDPFMDFLTGFAQMHGTTTLALHHSPKSNGDPSRGSGSIVDGADTALWMIRNDLEQKKQGKQIQREGNQHVNLYIYKQKETDMGDSIPFELVEYEGSLVFQNGLSDTNSGVQDAAGDALIQVQRGILECLEGTGVGDGMTKARIEKEIKEVAEEVGSRTSHSSLLRVINGVEELGWTVVVGGRGENKQGAEVVLTHAGKEWLRRLRLGSDGSSKPDHEE